MKKIEKKEKLAFIQSLFKQIKKDHKIIDQKKEEFKKIDQKCRDDIERGARIKGKRFHL